MQVVKEYVQTVERLGKMFPIYKDIELLYITEAQFQKI